MPKRTDRDIIIYSYDIDNRDAKLEYSDLLSQLRSKWEESESANDRRVVVEKTSTAEDVLAWTEKHKNYMLGAILRIAPTKEIATIPDDLFMRKDITLSGDSNELRSSPIAIVSTNYFLIDKCVVLTNIPPSRIDRLSKYFKAWFNLDENDKFYKFVPRVKSSNGLKLSDIKEIVFDGRHEIKRQRGSDGNEARGFRFGSKIMELAVGVINDQFQELSNFNEIVNKGLVSARLMVKFPKPKKMSEPDYRAALGAVIKPIADVDTVHFKLKNQKIINGKSLLEIYQFRGSLPDNVIIPDQEMIIELKKFRNNLTDI